ncbi:MAG: hypothetical protein ACI8PZ_005042 [Myxococcota bacterium]|jgi:hypothetical protein
MRLVTALFLAAFSLPALAADRDADGYDEAVDCDDADAAINPGAVEAPVADGIDQDCSGWADDLSVCADGGVFATVQAGVDAAPDGFTLVLCAGTYTENVHMTGGVLTVLGGSGAESTFLDAGGAGTAIRVDGGGELTLTDLTISGADSSGALCLDASIALNDVEVMGNTGTDGAGLRLDDCNVQVTDSWFHDNVATNRGGGLHALGSNGTIVNSVFDFNEGFAGGGVHIQNGDVDLTGNTIADNTATTSEEYNGGGGLFLQGDSDVTGNVIARNDSSYDGGGFYAKNADGDWTDNSVSDNHCALDGAGGYFEVSYGAFENNEVRNNNADDDAGGLRVYVSDMSVADNLFADNSANDDGGGLKLSHSANVVRRNDFLRNTAGDAGGGLEFDNESSGLEDCRFYQNHAGRGGGMHYWRNEAPVTLERNQFVENTADHCGGAIQVDNADHLVTLRTTLFRDNSSSDDGGDICIELHYQDDELTVFVETEMLVTNSVFTNSSAVDDGGSFYVNTGHVTIGNVVLSGTSAEDGMVTADGGHVTMVNAIMQNTTGDRAMYAKNEGTIDVRYSDFWNVEGTYDGMDDPIGLAGNFSADPGFVRPGRYRLAGGSACIDAGDPAISDVNGSRSDLGAFGGPYGR